MYARFAMCYLKMTGLDQDRQGLRRPAPTEAGALSNAQGGEAPEVSQSMETEALKHADAGLPNEDASGQDAPHVAAPTQVCTSALVLQTWQPHETVAIGFCTATASIVQSTTNLGCTECIRTGMYMSLQLM